MLGSVRSLLPAVAGRSIGIAGVLCLLFSVFSHSLDRIVDYKLTIYGLMVRFVVFYYRPDRIMGFMRQVLTLMSLRRLRPGHAALRAFDGARRSIGRGGRATCFVGRLTRTLDVAS